ncbi:sugar ABC transporter ATP-binding protein [Spirosoma validum]|uniref:Sugar ABC transporter ATP-binding protein n=1 Tax=Spirosoma validum TaxID=2771355 RepID=A0A927GBR3_9BACT|nr:sugar ABC transporter ATP-binding protein [Spirosoma validum]MBD2751750.1 sugar ABC transporter ATP-binding protein [Spirosoma validum]
MTSNQDYILQVRNLTKTFAGIKALNDVQLDLRKGEVHALMGENGAGKSTFMKILSGLETPDSGEISLSGTLLANKTVREAQRSGISMIHQEILAVPELTVAQNIFLGRELTHWLPGWLDNRSINQQAEKLLNHMGATINVRAKMKNLSVAEQQMVEIAKAISNNAQVLIMDEPTSALSYKEVDVLFKLIDELKQKGVAIIYISHKMEEIRQLADTITVLRDGNYIGTYPANELDTHSLINLMVGREINNLFPEASSQAGREVLRIENLTRQDAFSNISFTVHEGEILGIGGLMGAGRTELARAIFGLDRPESGEIYVKGQRIDITSPQQAIRTGIGYVSDDRKGWGFIPELSIKHNLTLASLPAHANGTFIDAKRETESAHKMIRELRIKTAGPDQKIAQLSGGNQQKVVIGKVLLASPSLIILDEPTRGIDVGAKFEIYKLIRQLAADGVAIIVISSELPELIGLSDRILVLEKGKQTALLDKAEASQEMILRYAMPN